MNYKYFFILFLAVIVGCNSSVDRQTKVKQEIKKQFDKTEGSFALAFISLADTTKSIMINENEMFHAASTMKPPVMVEVFKQAEAGRFSLDDSILIKNEFRSIVDSSQYQMDINEDSEGALYDAIGQKRTIRVLMNDMITQSSNLATNILIEKVRAFNVTETMRSYGADSILVLRGVEDIKAYEQGLSNRTNARDLMILFEKLGREEAVSQQASREMIGILKRQKFNEMIPAQLPDSVQVAHKTGWITGVNHDSGLIILPDKRKYVLVLLSKEVPNREEVIQLFADISKQIYDFVADEDQ